MSNSAHQIDVATLLADLQHRIQTNTNASGQASELTKAELTALHEALHELDRCRAAGGPPGEVRGPPLPGSCDPDEDILLAAHHGASAA